MIDTCSFCRCRGHSCVQGVKMIDDCLFCRYRGLSCVQGVLLGCIILTELPEHKKAHDIYKQTIIYHLNFLNTRKTVRMIDDCWFCRCRGLSCVQGVRMIDDCLFVDVVVFLLFREFC
jgi:hypothetical protein